MERKGMKMSIRYRVGGLQKYTSGGYVGYVKIWFTSVKPNFSLLGQYSGGGLC